MDPHITIRIAEPSDPGEARRQVSTLAGSLGFDATDVGRAALVATEAATNVLKHARRGEMLVRPVRDATDHDGVELLALDRGPGMADVDRCQQDGYSTAGSPGTGLGAIGRMATSLDIYSSPNLGTALLARVFPRGAKTRPAAGPLEIGAVQVAAPGETECGDDWGVAQSELRVVVAVADGLGHGSHAAKAAREAIRVFRENAHLAPEEILARAHGALLATRGAAVAIAELNLQRNEVCYAGLGNIAAALAWLGGARSMLGQNGTLGASFRQVRPMVYPWIPGGCLIMYSDGLTTHASVAGYPGLLARDPSLVAAVLYRDFVRGKDDTTVVVARQRGVGA